MIEDLQDDAECNKITKQKLVDMLVQRVETVKSELEGRDKDPAMIITECASWQEWCSHQKEATTKEA